jgi:hypothetical protein
MELRKNRGGMFVRSTSVRNTSFFLQKRMVLRKTLLNLPPKMQ